MLRLHIVIRDTLDLSVASAQQPSVRHGVSEKLGMIPIEVLQRLHILAQICAVRLLAHQLGRSGGLFDSRR